MAGMQKPVSKESVAIMGECLRIFVLLQTLSKVGECQRGFMSLLLEAVIVIFSIREVDSSEVLLIYVIIFKKKKLYFAAYSNYEYIHIRELMMLETSQSSLYLNLFRYRPPQFTLRMFCFPCLLHKDSNFRFF